jgi:hypothetical protein
MWRNEGFVNRGLFNEKNGATFSRTILAAQVTVTCKDERNL